MPPSETSRLHAYVTGRVQGVGYRFFVLETAHDLALVGWARNLPDRRVEVVAEGERSRLERLAASLLEGPRGAHVTDVDIEWMAPTGEFDAFRIVH
jgi:acylphosphatase